MKKSNFKSKIGFTKEERIGGSNWFFSKRSIKDVYEFAHKRNGIEKDAFKKNMILGISMAQKLLTMKDKLRRGWNTITIKTKGFVLVGYIVYFDGTNIMIPYKNDIDKFGKGYYSGLNPKFKGINLEKSKYKASRFKYFRSIRINNGKDSKNIYQFFNKPATIKKSKLEAIHIPAKFTYTLIPMIKSEFDAL